MSFQPTPLYPSSVQVTPGPLTLVPLSRCTVFIPTVPCTDLRFSVKSLSYPIVLNLSVEDGGGFWVPSYFIFPITSS